MNPPSAQANDERPDTICRACRTRDCCSAFDVALTGPDVVRIARALAVAPITFCRAIPADALHVGAFSLDGTAARWILALDRREGRDGAASCVFLIELNTRRRLCGLDTLAPGRCRTFPVLAPEDPHDTPTVSDAPTMIGVHSGPGCWRAWSVDEIDRDRAHRRLRHLTEERRAHAAAVETWNRAIADRPGRQQLETFVDYLMNQFAAPHYGAPFDVAAGVA